MELSEDVGVFDIIPSCLQDENMNFNHHRIMNLPQAYACGIFFFQTFGLSSLKLRTTSSATSTVAVLRRKNKDWTRKKISLIRDLRENC